MAEPSRIVVATSIPPKLSRADRGIAAGPAYQKLCVRSWIDCGFRVLSVNAPDEIPGLAALYPEVVFIPAERMSTRKTPYIADLLTALLATPERYFGIVNADILFEPAASWRQELPSLLERAVVAIQRYDTTALIDGALRRYYWGYDCFFFGREVAADAAQGAGEFAMGLPWWDYWFPASAMLKGREVRVLERPLTLHLWHPQGYPNATLQRYARAFAKEVSAAAGPRELHPDLAAILPVCRELIAMPEPEGDSASEDRKISDTFARQVIPWRETLAANVVHLGSPSAGTAAPFERLQDRLWAGAACESARYLGYLGNIADSARMYRAALDRTPQDFEILMGFGEHLCGQRDPDYALSLFERAALQQPDSARVRNAIGVALQQMGRREESVALFERALGADPDFREAPYNLAMTLMELGRAQEAMARIDAALSKWPDDAELQELRRHFSEKTREPNPPTRR